MRIGFITRSTLFTVPGGDTEQITHTASCLKEIGVEADICLTNKKINYNHYDLLHFSNITRPSDILYHIRKTDKPFVISPNFVDYTEYDKRERKGITGFIFQFFSGNTNEYLKTISRWILKKDVLRSKSYLARGHGRSIRAILEKASVILPTSYTEYINLQNTYSVERPYSVVPNGIDQNLFIPNGMLKDNNLVVCAARIEGLKNQLNLIKALNNTPFTLMIVGDPAPNQKKYYKKCKSMAADNVLFTGRLLQKDLVRIYKRAKVHVLPSWFETCGLSTLEAAAMGCNVVITDRGYANEYFGKSAFYCDPSDPASILAAVQEASKSNSQKDLQARILKEYSWQRSAGITLAAYKKIISN